MRMEAEPAEKTLANLLEKLFLPERLLPSQTGSRFEHAAGEKHLCAMLLLTAIWDLESVDAAVRVPTLRWVSEPDRGWFTLREVCEYLKLEMELVRAKLLAGISVKRHGRPKRIRLHSVGGRGGAKIKECA